MRSKLVRITTVPQSLKILLKGQLKFMSNNGFDVIGVSSEGQELLDVKEQEGVDVFNVEMSRKITPIEDLVALWNLYRYFMYVKPLIVHTHTPKAGTIGMIAAKMAGVPIRLHTVAGLPLLGFNGIKRRILNIVEKLTYACATKVYPNSFGLSRIIEECGFCSVEKLKVIANGSSNGINTEYFDPSLFSNDISLKEKLGIKANNFVFIFVGRLVGDKGINELIKAFEILQSNHQNCNLLLVGDSEPHLDPLRPETLRIIQANDNIISVGFQSDVRPFYAISDCLVLPSYREGFPNVILQSGAMGLPCIATDINGCNEIIHDGLNGFLVPVKNVTAIVDKMSELLANKVMYKILQQDARAMIKNRFEQKLVWVAIMNEYNSLICNLRPPTAN
jgi:glycosyltransferase involved in cell wall biosynthesis